MEYTAQQLDSLRHMLGVNDPYQRVPRPWRNYAAVNPGDLHYVDMAELGLVERYKTAGGVSEYDFYRCTEAGIAAALKSHRTIGMSRSKRMYARYLSVADAVPDLTFKQFIIAIRRSRRFEPRRKPTRQQPHEGGASGAAWPSGQTRADARSQGWWVRQRE